MLLPQQQSLVLRPRYDVANGLVLWLPFDNGTANDVSGYQVNGTIVGSPTIIGGIVPGVGIPGNAINLNGTSQYITVPKTTLTNFLGPFSIASWIYLPSTIPSSPGFAYFASSGYDGTNTQYEFYGNHDGTVGFDTFYGATGHGVTSTGTMALNRWQHWTGTFDGAVWKIYKNGVLDNSHADSNPPIHTNIPLVGIGAGYDTVITGFNAFFQGALDDVRFYNRGLSGGEVYSLYASTFMPWMEAEMEVLSSVVSFVLVGAQRMVMM